MKTLIDVLAALSDFVKVASEWAESASKAEMETFTQICPQKKKRSKSSGKGGHTGRSPQRSGKSVPQWTKEMVLKLLQKYGGSRLSEVPPERYAALFADAQEAAHAE